MALLHFEAEVEIDGGEDSKHAWFVQDPLRLGAEEAEPPLAWQPLRRADQERLEAALGLDRVPPSVSVDGGRAEVWLNDRLYVDKYGSLPPRPPCSVQRSLWVSRSPGCERWEPFEEAVDVGIENAYQDLLQNAKDLSQTKLSPNAQLTQTVQLFSAQGSKAASLHLRLRLTSDPLAEERRVWELAAEEVMGANWLQSAHQHLLRRIVQVRRGFGEVPLQPGELEEAALSDGVGRVFVVVHDAGERTDPCARRFRQHVQRSQLLAAGFQQETEGEPWTYSSGSPAASSEEAPLEPPKIRKDEVIEISWSELLRLPELKRRLERISLKTLPRGRQLIGDIMASTLFYAQEEKRAAIQLAVHESVEAALAVLQARRSPTGGVVLVGHGLAGVVLWELVRAQRFSFRPQVLVALGSPLGALLQLTDDEPFEPDFKLPSNVRFLNIFHPLDPLAYRIEPLLAAEYEREPPKQVPPDVRKVTKKLLEAKAKNGPALPHLSISCGARVDWVLEASLGATAEQAGGGSTPRRRERNNASTGDLQQAALAAHSCYLDSPEVASFTHAAASLLSTWGTDGSLEDFLAADDGLWVPVAEFKDEPMTFRKGLGNWSLDTLRKQIQQNATNTGRDIQEKWEDSAACAATDSLGRSIAQKSKDAGVTDVVVGTFNAAAGVVGVARAVGGSVRLVSGAIGGVGGLVDMALQGGGQGGQGRQG